MKAIYKLSAQYNIALALDLTIGLLVLSDILSITSYLLCVYMLLIQKRIVILSSKTNGVMFQGLDHLCAGGYLWHLGA